MKIICIEGIDAVGKETTSKALENQLKEFGYNVKRVSFPRYDKPIGAAIKDILNTPKMDAPSLDNDLVSPLYTLDRIQYFRENIEELRKECDYLILDRGFYSNVMYQASKLYKEYPSLNGVDSTEMSLENISLIGAWIIRNYFSEFENTLLDGIVEDVHTFILSMSIEDSAKQIQNRSEKDTNESNQDYLKKCKDFTNRMLDSRNRKKFVEYISDYFNSQDLVITDIARDIINKICKYYIVQVYDMPVKHAETENEIQSSVYSTVNKICSMLHIGNKSSKHLTLNNEESNKGYVYDTSDIAAINQILAIYSHMSFISKDIYELYKYYPAITVYINDNRITSVIINPPDNYSPSLKNFLSDGKIIDRTTIASVRNIEKCDCSNLFDMKITYSDNGKINIARIDRISNKTSARGIFYGKN